MDATEMYYLTYDPDEIWDEMHRVYIAEGGDVLYPGDEKEILLRAVQAILVQSFAGVDNALRMATLRYAVGDYLDAYGAGRMCERISEAPAKGKVTITFRDTGVPGTLAAGIRMTADGERFYALAESVMYTGYAQEIVADIVCTEGGIRGNGVKSGAPMQLAQVNNDVISIIALIDVAGGMDRETDDAYRDRIYSHGLASVTTGPAIQYESIAKRTSSQIIDAKALNDGPGFVRVILIVSDDEWAETVIIGVENALCPNDVRPLTDIVSVELAGEAEFLLKIEYKTDVSADSATTAAINRAVSEYLAWQNNKIGRPFNPDRLIADLYRAGVTRAVIGSGSHIMGGTAEYTEIGEDKRCTGEVNLVMT